VTEAIDAAKKYHIAGEFLTIEEIRRKLVGPKCSRYRATVPLVSGQRLLDIGCGVGGFAEAFQAQVAEIVGIDSDPDAVAVAEVLYGGERVRFVRGELLSIGFPDNSFDCVTFLECIEHVPAPQSYLEEIYRILKPGGTLVLSTPNAFFYTLFFKNLLRFSKKWAMTELRKIETEKPYSGTEKDHIYLWDLPTLYRLLYRQGFCLLEYRFVGAPPLGPCRRWWKGEWGILEVIAKPFLSTLLLKLEKRSLLTVS